MRRVSMGVIHMCKCNCACVYEKGTADIILKYTASITLAGGGCQLDPLFGEA